MRKARGQILLEPGEVERYFGKESGLHCEHEWIDDEPELFPINPDGKFVVDYGNVPVYLLVVKNEGCVKCGLSRLKK